jgi:hypothetical protein
MTRRDWTRALAAPAVCIVLLAGGILRPSAGQSATRSAAKDDLLSSWKDIGRKLADMAADFPEDKYDWKPTPEVRSFAEQLLHAAGYANYVREVAAGHQRQEQDPPRGEFKTKPSVVEYVRKAFAAGEAAIEQASDQTLQSTVQVGRSMVSLYGFWDTVVEHSGEHYGQLVMFYRINKMVPPESRPRSR